MKEIGGYLEIEKNRGYEYHQDCIRLNTARNCLRYLIRNKNIKKIYLPYLLCSVIEDVCREEHIEVKYYSVLKNFKLQLPNGLEEDEYLYIINYYGQYEKSFLEGIVKQYQRVIIDNVQAFFEKPILNVDTIYTCRKFFGVTDGAYLYSQATNTLELETDKSYNRIAYLFGRMECSANEFYSEYQENEEILDYLPVKQMSAVTQNILKGIDYNWVKKKRTENYLYLCERLKEINQLNVRKIEGAYMYPLLLDNAEYIRKRLQARKVYIPVLWPNVVKDRKNMYEGFLAENILPLPCDQRYDLDDMQYVIDLIVKFMEEC